MKMHPSLVDRILYLCTNYGGHKDEKRLVAHLDALRMATYVNDAGICIVDAQAMISARRARNQPIDDIVPMKFESHGLQKLLYMYNMYSGHSNEAKMRNALSSMSFKPYTRSSGETVIILEEHYMQVLQASKA